jgi:hypothetical protein
MQYFDILTTATFDPRSARRLPRYNDDGLS